MLYFIGPVLKYTVKEMRINNMLQSSYDRVVLLGFQVCKAGHEVYIPFSATAGTLNSIYLVLALSAIEVPTL